jgi:DNA mismatch repair protein PMS2
MNIFHTNGFDFKEDDQGHFLLTAVPFSKDTVFGIQDVQELLHLIISGNPATFQMSSQSVSSSNDLSAQPTKVVRPSRYTSCILTMPSLLVSEDVLGVQMSVHWLSKPQCGCRVRAMLAMRACRSSVMIGKALTVSQMQTILSRLSTLESPWNCPHGRPTLRHLSTLS